VLASAEVIQLREASRHLLRWEITQEAGAQAVLTWARILAVAVRAGFLVAAGDSAVAVDAVVAADADNEAIKILCVEENPRSWQLF